MQTTFPSLERGTFFAKVLVARDFSLDVINQITYIPRAQKDFLGHWHENAAHQRLRGNAMCGDIKPTFTRPRNYETSGT